MSDEHESEIYITLRTYSGSLKEHDVFYIPEEKAEKLYGVIKLLLEQHEA